MATRKTSKGRQRVEMTKIKNKNQLQVTFSKRCAGLFKKASELCTLCGVEIAIIVFSPAGKPFSFGHPSVESIVAKFLKNTASCMVSSPCVESLSSELQQQMQWLLQQQEAEKIKAEMLDEMRQAGRNKFWWEAPVHNLGLLELQQLQAALKDLKKNVASTQVELLLPSDPFQLSVDSWAKVTLEEQQVSDDASYIPATSYQIPTHSYDYEPGFY
ncbi:unnamed protein product [Rhodiola kirilowii]